MNWLTRTFTAEGQRRLAIVNGAMEWLSRQLLPPAPDREYPIEFNTEDHGQLACLLRTREFEDQGHHWVAMDIWDGSVLIATLVLEPSEGLCVNTLWH